MDRIIVKSGQIPLETDLLNDARSTLLALGWLAQGVLGSGTLVDGLSCVPTAPASLTVQVTPGQIFSLQSLDATSYSTLAADTVHQVVKQGLALDTQSFVLTAPSTGGQSQNYLVQASYSDLDDTPVVRPYYNSANPSVGLSGPGGSGASDNTFRRGKCLVSVKAGTPATTGSQVTPTPDPGYTGLYAITVANGQTTVTSGNIAQLITAPFISPKLPAVPAGVQNSSWTYCADTGTANALVVATSPPASSYAAGQRLQVKVGNLNTGASTINRDGLGNKSILTRLGNPLVQGDLPANAIVDLLYDGTAWRLMSADIAARQWRMDGQSGVHTILHATQTAIYGFGSLDNTMTGSTTVNQGTGIVTIGAADAGVYALAAGGGVNGASLEEYCTIQVNGTDVAKQWVGVSTASDSLDQAAATVIRLNAGDVVNATYYQTNAGAVSRNLAAVKSLYFAGARIAS